jgi:hypothetical protein
MNDLIFLLFNLVAGLLLLSLSIMAVGMAIWWVKLVLGK